MKSYHGNGKLLLTGEYFVLDGARAFALPVRLGQGMVVEGSPDPEVIHWRGVASHLEVWFRARFRRSDLEIVWTNRSEVAERLQHLLRLIRQDRPDLFEKSFGVRTAMMFPKNWGLGSSSTLVHCLARWSKLDPYYLLENSFGGSGYDLACAISNQPLFYQLADNERLIEPFDWQPEFAEQVYFLYLGKKQNSREGIARYREKVKSAPELVDEVTKMTNYIAQAETLKEFEYWLEKHEEFVAEHLQLERAKDLYFGDYWGTIKSLGAWGGDFVLATSNRPKEETQAYFNSKGMTDFFTFQELIC